MSKKNTIYVCQECEAQFPKWMGQCSSCGKWNSLAEEISNLSGSSTKVAGKGSSYGKKISKQEMDQFLTTLSQVEVAEGLKKRFSSSIGELDRVLGGGFVPGMVVLIGGEPGIGKSTLLTQMMIGMLIKQGKEQNIEVGEKKTQSTSSSGFNEKSQPKKTILYISGEESPSQISIRISRILENEQFIYSQSKAVSSGEKKSGIDANIKHFIEQNLTFVTTTDTDQITSVIEKIRPQLVIVDSIQTLSTDDLTGASGSVGQLRESTDRVVSTVKKLGIPTFLVGHVTKEGAIAGPKILEHIVDSVIEISGERTGQLRLIRSLKNRFGATDEVGVFRLVEYGLEEVTNPSELFLENTDQDIAGTAIVCVMEGSRPLLVEVQALVVNSQLAMPRRVGRGIELSRIQVLSAILQKHGNLPLGDTDVFVNAAGGFVIKEPAVDLGLVVAIASSYKNKKITQKTVFIGEIGLLGEIRSVSYLEKRIKEAKRLGYKNVISRQSHKRVIDVLKDLGL